MKDLSQLEKYRCVEDELQCYGTVGNNGNGVFKVFVNGKSFFCIASNGGGWEHVSVHRKNKQVIPSWEEMCAIKDMFFEPEETVVQYHPPKSEYVNVHEYCLHLWRPTEKEIVRPPIEFV